VSSFISGVVRGADSPNGYDLDDLVALASPRPVARLRPVNHLNQPLDGTTDQDVVRSVLEFLGQHAG
jgi:hypothetical protein